MDIRGCTAIVTGGGSGIGRATAIRLAELGAVRVALVDVDESGLGGTAALVAAAGASASTHACDVADAAALARTFDEVAKAGPIDIVFNNAGVVSGAALFPDAEPERAQRIIDINVMGVIVGTQLAIRHMAGRGGVVVNTGSTSHNSTGFRDILYSTSKAAVVQFTSACGQLHAATGVRVCGVNPTLVDTPIIDTTGGAQCADWMAPVLANNRALPPEAIAKVVVDLIEDDEAVGRVVDATLSVWEGETRQLAGPGDRTELPHDRVLAMEMKGAGR